MKKLSFSLIAIVAMLVVGCGPKVPEQTIKNLKAAFDGESTASAKYEIYAQKACQDSMYNVAKLFHAASVAEGIHADNLKKVLIKLGSTDTVANIGTIEPKSTLENIQDAINGEKYEVDTMYPEFIAVAEKENCVEAITVYRWALDTEAKHHAFYTAALEKAATDEASLPSIYFVCPKCGNTFTDLDIEDPCSFCQTARAAYINTTPKCEVAAACCEVKKCSPDCAVANCPKCAELNKACCQAQKCSPDCKDANCAKCAEMKKACADKKAGCEKQTAVAKK